MKHNAEDLLRISYEYFPRGIEQRDPAYEQSPEFFRQKEARIPASDQYETWRGLLRRLSARFPKERFAGVEVSNKSPFLQSPTAGANLDRCFTGELSLPIRSGIETHHWLEFLVSFVVPYYVVGSCCYVPVEPGDPQPAIAGTKLVKSFDLSSDELPFARAIVDEIEKSFPGYEPIEPAIGQMPVPDVDTAYRSLGEATIFTCLFSDSW
jgi:hypothetical protein